MKKLHFTLFLVCLAFLVFMLVCPSSVSGSPGRRGGGGGGRKSSSGGSSWFGSSSSKKQQNSGWGSSSNYGGSYKKKGSKMSTLKKAAVIGAVAYGGYQLGKLSGRFGGYGHGHGYGFNDWNRWREIDGFMCRDTNDCNWMDSRLYCQDYELDFRPSALWFGGDAARIVGECACPHGMVWDNREMECEYQMFGGGMMGSIGLVGLIIGIIMAICCCACGVLLVRRVFS